MFEEIRIRCHFCWFYPSDIEDTHLLPKSNLLKEDGLIQTSEKKFNYNFYKIDWFNILKRIDSIDSIFHIKKL